MVYMMQMWIEIEPKLPYALIVPPQADAEADADIRFYIHDFFNSYCFNEDENVGGIVYTLIPDPGEADAAVDRGDITEYPKEHKVRIKDITSILAQKA